MARTWRDSVLDAMRRSAVASADGLVYRYRLLQDELDRIADETGSVGKTPGQTLSRILQDLRDEGEIEFVDKGVYRLVEAPVNVEEVELTELEIDSRIRRKLLNLGRVQTDNPISIARRRKGQERIRAMTLQNYGNQCALCDISDTSLLIASHIVPWSVSEEARGDLSNVVCLCRFHDVLFELGYWSLGEQYEVMVKSQAGGWPITALLPKAIIFRLSSAFEPSQLYIAQHRQRHGFNTI